MNIIYGNITDRLKEPGNLYFLLPFEPHPKRWRLTGAAKAMMKAHKIRLGDHSSASEEVKYHYEISNANIIYFMMPVRKWQPGQKPGQPIDLKMLAERIKRTLGLAGANRVSMPYPEKYTTPERSWEVLDVIQANSKESLILHLIKPLPHQ